MHPADYTTLGILVLQHHDAEKGIGGRRFLKAMRVHPPEDEYDDAPGHETYGEVLGGLFWPEAGGFARDGVDAWWLSGPAVAPASPGRTCLPMVGADQLDGELAWLTPDVPSWARDWKLPAGWPWSTGRWFIANWLRDCLSREWSSPI